MRSHAGKKKKEKNWDFSHRMWHARRMVYTVDFGFLRHNLIGTKYQEQNRIVSLNLFENWGNCFTGTNCEVPMCSLFLGYMYH